MEESILSSVKKTLGIESDYNAFDAELTVFINSGFLTLSQLGIGPSGGFAITDGTETWSDFIGDRVTDFNAVKNWMYLFVKPLFDPPNGGYLISAINDQRSELEYRLKTQAEIGFID